MITPSYPSFRLMKAALAAAIVALAAPAALADVYYEVNTAPTARNNAYRQGEVLVKFKTESEVNVRRNAAGRYQSAGVGSVDNVMHAIGASEVEQLMPLTGKLPAVAPRRVKSISGGDVELKDLSKLYRVKVGSDLTVEDAVAKLQALPEVEFAEPNYIAYVCAADEPNDPLYPQQWGIPAVNADKLWSLPTITDKRPVIAILDTGVEIEHPDLATNIWNNETELAGSTGYDDDGNGFTDDYHGWDFINNTGFIADYSGHGTHCAGIAAAVGNNGVGICGANPDALLMPVTVMQSDGTGDLATIIRGIDYATANGADVISMSFGTYAYSLALEQSLARAYMNSVLVAAAGNDGHSITPGMHCMKDSPMFPAAYTFVFGVQASSQKGLAPFSNFDDDGPIAFNAGCFSEEEMFNYELTAPGTDIVSTYPGGKYKSLNGTSMACPLVAGAISRLLSVKQYNSKEVLFGDLIHSAGANVDFAACYDIDDSNRKANVSIVSWRIEDDKDNDGNYDAGETIKLFPTIRNEWGHADNIIVWMELGENEGKVVEISQAMADFSKPLSSYAKAESANPLIFKINDDVANGRHIRLKLYVQCDGMSEPTCQDFTIIAESGMIIGGMIDTDMTLTADTYYTLNRALTVPAGVTLTIEPGAHINLNGFGILQAKDSHIIAEGTPSKRIVFENGNLSSNDYNGEWGEIDGKYMFLKIQSTLVFKYCEFISCWVSYADAINCIFNDSFPNAGNVEFSSLEADGNHSFGVSRDDGYSYSTSNHNNYINYGRGGVDYYGNYFFTNQNLVNTTIVASADGRIVYLSQPSYFGASIEKNIRKNIKDIESDIYSTSKLYTNNLLTQPHPDNHAIVWKVLVNGYDAQDEFEQLPPLGIGRHKFEVWYSKKIDETIAPNISIGIRPPYVQVSVNEDGSWRTETTTFVSKDANGNVIEEREVEHSVYTVYLTIKGGMDIDGLNRIRVSGGRDLEYFEIPDERYRFNVEVSAAGSMSTGFMATPGIGKIDLEWEDLDMNIEDIMGYNLYRIGERQVTEWGYDDDWNWVEKPVTVVDTIRLNQRLIDEPRFTDFDVVPGKRYDYYYKVMRTDMAENSPSRVVSAVPLTAAKGDANGSLSVDVADVVTEISYLTGGDPQPFIFEAADVNNDSEINILDVVGTINIILRPAAASIESEGGMVKYWLQDGVVYIDTDVALGGVQFSIEGADRVRALEALNGFEVVSQPVDGRILFLAYSMVGRTLAPGKYALVALEGGEGSVGSVVCSDNKGHNVVALQSDLSGMSLLDAAQMRIPYPNPFTDAVNIPFVIGDDQLHAVEIRLTDFSGRTLHRHVGTYGYGEHSYQWTPAIQSGIYLAALYIDGTLVQSAKLIKK